MKIYRINTYKKWSDVRVFNDITTFIEIADSDTTTDIKWQVEATLALISSDKIRILPVTIYITDFANFGALNEI